MIDNRTAWAAAMLGVADRDGEPALCLVVEATCDLSGRPLEEQPEINLDGVWDGDPAATAPREAPCATMVKPGTDCLLHGYGHARSVRFHIGPVMASARLCGARQWVRRWHGIRPGPEAAFTPVPLIWEEAAGAQPANPVGCGVVGRRERFREGVALPRLEHPTKPMRRWGDRPAPVGFGPTAPAWAHRHDADPFAPASQQVAAPELIAPRLRGDEAVLVEGCRQPIATRLPGLPPPTIRLIRRQGDLTPALLLDTVLVDADAGTIRLTWRGWTLVGEHAWVEAVEIR